MVGDVRFLVAVNVAKEKMRFEIIAKHLSAALHHLHLREREREVACLFGWLAD